MFKQRYKGQLAHEVFHTWLGKKIDVKLDKGSKIYRDHWFTEGLTDYFASKIRLDAGIINQEQFKNYINELLLNIADNPYSNYTLSELETLASAGGYGTAAVKLQYYRGALIALNLEAELLEKKSDYTLKDILNELLLEANKRDDKFSREELFTFFKKFDLNLEPLFNSYIINAETIMPKPNALGSTYKLVKKEHNVFDFGFNYYQSDAKGIVSGVDKHSEACKVGLRDGQKFIDLDYTNRFGAAWEESDLVSVKISESDQEKEFKYLPKGHKILILQYELRK